MWSYSNLQSHSTEHHSQLSLNWGKIIPFSHVPCVVVFKVEEVRYSGGYRHYMYWWCLLKSICRPLCSLITACCLWKATKWCRSCNGQTSDMNTTAFIRMIYSSSMECQTTSRHIVWLLPYLRLNSIWVLFSYSGWSDLLLIWSGNLKTVFSYTLLMYTIDKTFLCCIYCAVMLYFTLNTCSVWAKNRLSLLA